MLAPVLILIPWMEKLGVAVPVRLGALRSPTILFEILMIEPTPPAQIIPLTVFALPEPDKSKILFLDILLVAPLLFAEMPWITPGLLLAVKVFMVLTVIVEVFKPEAVTNDIPVMEPDVAAARLRPALPIVLPLIVTAPVAVLLIPTKLQVAEFAPAPTTIELATEPLPIVLEEIVKAPVPVVASPFTV